MYSFPHTYPLARQSTSHQSQNNLPPHIFFSLSKLPPHIHSHFIFTSFFPSSFCSTVTPISCYHLRFVLLSSQACVYCCRSRFIVSFLSIFSFIFFLPSPFFPEISLSRYEKLSVFTFRPGRNGTIFKTLVHAVSEKRKKKNTPLGHRSPASLTGIGVRHVSDTGTLLKMACRCNHIHMYSLYFKF